MKIEGWEWRTLPEDKGRLGRWKGRHGLWLVRREGFSGVVADVSGAVGRRPGMMMRPLSAGGEIVPWDEWMCETHPEPPEGYAQQGPWLRDSWDMVACLDMLCADGRVVKKGESFKYAGWACAVKPVALTAAAFAIPDGWEADGEPMEPLLPEYPRRRGERQWLDHGDRHVSVYPAGDVWTLPVRRIAPPVTWADVPSDVYPAPLERGSCEIVRGAVVVGHLALRADGRSWVWSNGNGWAGVEPTMPAAIVALLKAAGGEG